MSNDEWEGLTPRPGPSQSSAAPFALPVRTGAGLDCAVVGEGGGSAAGLVDRLAARWNARGPHAPDGPLGVSCVHVARFFLLAIADEIERNMAPGFTPEVHPDIRAAAGVQFSETLRWLRTEAGR